MRFLSLIALLLLGSLASFPLHANSTCAAIPGSESLEQARVVIFGEYHGTGEIPSLFLEETCRRLEDGEKLLVALELDESLAPIFHKLFIDGENSDELLMQLEELSFWDGLADGRHGRANLELIRNLAKLRQRFSSLRVIALHRDMQMPVRASRRITGFLEANEDYRALLLVGNAHARLTRMKGQPSQPLASRLFETFPDTVSLTVRASKGKIIACIPGGCQPVSFAQFNPEMRQRHIHIFQQPAAWHGYFYLPELTVTEPVR